MKVELREVTLRFAQPIQTSYATLRERELIVLSLTGTDGITGRGEAAPLEPYDGVGLEQVREALEAYRPVLADAGDAAGQVPSCWMPAGRPRTCPRRSPRWTWRSGIGPRDGRDDPWRRCCARSPRPTSWSTPRSPTPTARGPQQRRPGPPARATNA